MSARSVFVMKSALLAFSLALSFGAVELALRIIAPSNPYSSTFPLYPYHKREILATYQGKVHMVVQQMNRWGFRGDDPPANWSDCSTIVAVGGSTTQCYYLDDKQTWPARLQAKLAKDLPCVWVGNAGLDGHSTFGHKLLVSEVVSKIRPKIILYLVGINDLALGLNHQHSLYDKMGDWKWNIFKHSRVVQMLYTWKLIAFDHAHHVQNVPLDYEPQTLTDPAPVPSDLRTLIPGLEEYKANLRTLIALSRSVGSEPVMMTQPLLWSNTPLWQIVKADLYWAPRSTKRMSAATFSQLMDIYNDALIDVCNSEKVHVIDLARAVPKEPANYLDMAHFSAIGADVVATVVAKDLTAPHPVSDHLTTSINY